MAGIRGEGFNGRLMVEPNAGGAPATLADLINWGFDVAVENWENPGLEDVWKKTMRGLKGFSGTLEGYWKKEGDTDSATVWQWLHELANATREYRWCYLYPNAKNDSTRYFYGSLALTAFSTSTPMGDAVKWTASWVGTDYLYHSTISET